MLTVPIASGSNACISLKIIKSNDGDMLLMDVGIIPVICYKSRSAKYVYQAKCKRQSMWNDYHVERKTNEFRINWVRAY